MLRAEAATSREPHDFSLVVGGPLYRAYLRTRLADAQLGRVPRRLLAFFLITWAPLAVLSAIDTHTARAAVSFAGDIDAHARLLLALPLLVVAEPIVHQRLTLVVRQFIDRGLIAPVDLRRYIAAVVSSVKLRNSATFEGLVLLVAIVGGHWLWESRMSLNVGTWYNDRGADGATHLTLAGRWYVLVSLPIFRFLAFRWLARLIVVWYRFLWLVSRIPLRLNALHPDRTGGLGFLNASPFAFVPILVAETSLLSALIAERIWHEGATLPQFKFEILAVVAFLMLLVLLPQMFFTFQLERAWRFGAADYGVLGSHYVEGFRRKWLCAHPHTRESLVGSADIQSLADLANAFEVIRGMYLVPISRDTVLRLGLVIVMPLLPLVLTMIPFDQIVDRAIQTFI
jgi:hypothetical protein